VRLVRLPAADALIRRVDTGERLAPSRLVGECRTRVWGLDRSLRMRPTLISNATSAGVQQSTRVLLASGRIALVTLDQQVRVLTGPAPTVNLSVGEAIAVSRHVPEPLQPTEWPSDHLILLAHLLGDGCVARDPIYYCSADEANLEVVEKAARSFGVDTRRSPGRGVTYVHFPMVEHATWGRTNPLYDWLRDLDVYGKVAHNKQVPAAIHQLHNADTALFLRHLWATDGSVTIPKAGQPRIYYATTSRRLADDVQAMLLRLDIGARLSAAPVRDASRHKQGWMVRVSGRADQLQFVIRIGVHGARERHCRAAFAALSGLRGNPNVDVIPREVWDYTRDVMAAKRVTSRELARRLEMSYCGSTLYKAGVSQRRLARVAEALDDDWLRDLATAQIRWDRVTRIEPAGEIEVCELELADADNLFVNDVLTLAG